MTQGSAAPNTLLSAKGINYAPNTAHAQVESVSNLYGVGGAASAGIGVGFGSITDKDLDARMCPEPGDERLSFACFQDVDGRVSFQVDQQRAIRLASAERKIVDAQHARGWHRPSTEPTH